MDVSGYFAVIVVGGMIVALALELASADFILLAGLILFMLTGIITPVETFAGFSNRGMLTVAVLFIVSSAISNTGALDGLSRIFLSRKPKGGISSMMLRMMIPISFASAFLNNTPIVVMFVPMIKSWAERFNFSASKFLIPLSYAAIFGGVCTLIGTSTNLVVHGLMIDNNMSGFSMFELAKVGIPCALIGWLYMAFIGKRILPDNRDMAEVVGEKSKEYMIEMKVKKDCEFIGKTIQNSGLRNMKNVFLIQIERNEITLGPVSGNEKICENDTLMFAGVTSAVVDLYHIKGLISVEEEKVYNDFRSMRKHLIEVVISSNSPILNQTVKECRFREKYDAGVIAVHRNGERIKSKVGSIKVKAGDVLLLLTKPVFEKRWRNSQDFFLISNVEIVEHKAYHKAYIAAVILLLMVLTATFGKHLPEIGGTQIGMLQASFAAAILMVLTKCTNYSKARNSIRWDILIIIACALGISKALQNSGAADAIAGSMIDLVKFAGPIGILAAVYLLTTIFTEVITNNAAAAMMFPIAFSASTQMSVNPKPFFIAIAIAASASFATPIGYQTNLIVQGAGGYKFRDYLKVGLPLNLSFFILAVVLIPIFWPF
ncbi:SLC13 family permease [bacterium]|nr:SLC13 family permease [bacterium]